MEKKRKVNIKVYPTLKVNMITSWNERCGIASYSAFLAHELKKKENIKMYITPISRTITLNPVYFLVLGFKSGRTCDIAHIQFEYGLFSDLKIGRYTLTSLAALIFYIGFLFNNSRVVTTLHEIRKEKSRKRVGQYYIKLLYKIIFNISDLIIVHTSASKKILLRDYHIAENKVKVISHGCYETPLFMVKETCKAELNLLGKKVITVLGFVNKTKGHDLVIKLIPYLDEKIHVLIAGGPRIHQHKAFFEYLKKMVEQLDCAKKITFLGYIPDEKLSVVLNATDLALLPYRETTQSGILHILIAHRIPTITSDLEAFKEIKDKYGCIELFKTENQEELLTKIVSLLNNEKRQRYLSEQCQKMWDETKWSSIATEYVITYLEAFAGHSDSVYDEERQRERIDWLKANVFGLTIEIGCATGFVTSYTSAMIGIDLNAHRIKLAKIRHREQEFLVSSAMCLPFKSNSIDTVLIPEILEHMTLAQAKKVVAECRRVGRKLLVTLPNADKVNYDKSLVENPEHKWLPTRNIIENFIEDNVVEYTTKKDFILVATT